MQYIDHGLVQSDHLNADTHLFLKSACARDSGAHAIVAGRNYGQGSSRENAALVPRLLGLRVVVAQDFARIHWQNLISFGVLPLTFATADDRRHLGRGAVLRIADLRQQLSQGRSIQAEAGDGRRLALEHELSPRQTEILSAGGVIGCGACVSLPEAP